MRRFRIVHALARRLWIIPSLGVVVADLPLKVGGRPISRHLSPTHGLAVLSVPALARCTCGSGSAARSWS